MQTRRWVDFVKNIKNNYSQIYFGEFWNFARGSNNVILNFLNKVF